MCERDSTPKSYLKSVRLDEKVIDILTHPIPCVIQETPRNNMCRLEHLLFEPFTMHFQQLLLHHGIEALNLIVVIIIPHEMSRVRGFGVGMLMGVGDSLT